MEERMVQKCMLAGVLSLEFFRGKYMKDYWIDARKMRDPVMKVCKSQ